MAFMSVGEVSVTCDLLSIQSTASSRVPIEIRRFPWIRRLAGDYAFEYSRVADFFTGNPAEPSAWRDAIDRTQRYTRQHGAIADIASAQQQRRGAPAEALAAAARLRDPRTVAIVTGQQAGLFGGPLFTLLKALTALNLAEQAADDHGVPTVAVFWIDAEDHDWDEVKTCGVLNGDLDLSEVALPDLPGAGTGPVSRVRLDDSVSSTLDAIAALLPPTEFTPAVLDALRQAYQPGVGMADAFGRWLEAVLGRFGLIVFDSSDPAAKPLAASLFAREIERAGATSRLAAEAGSTLVSRGYHAQVTPQEDHAALFHIDGVRSSITVQDAPSWLDRVRTQPDAFSPNVLLRPLVQDTLFPTVAYVAGPNELAYLAQLRPVYAAFGLPMPLMYQRTTATILDANAMRVLTRHDLPLESLRARDDGVLNQLLEAQIPAAVTTSMDDAVRGVEERMDVLARAVAQLDATLEGAARSAAGRMQDDLKKLHAKIIQSIKRKDETLRRQFKHAQAQAFPGGHPQERALGFLYFLNKYGFALVDRLKADLPLDQGTHWVLTL
jgi:bacillithiol biosynthesis cysteine-adding enzyme BshC